MESRKATVRARKALAALWLVLVGAGICGADSPEVASGSATPTPAPTAQAEFQKGISYASWARGDYASAKSDGTLEQVIKPMGVEWISVIVTCRQETITSTAIMRDEANCTATDDDLRHVIRKAHELGLRVMLKPHIDLSNDPKHWRGEINLKEDEAAWAAWFASYTAFITHYAAIAREAGAESFCVGTELAGTSRRAEEWRAVIAGVRAAYAGGLIYAANWGEETRITWWDAVDAIGVDAYYPFLLRDNPSVEELTAAWGPRATRLEALSTKWDRPVIFTEIGYRSLRGMHRDPANWQITGEVDLQAQADCYEAVFAALSGKAWWRGVYWWAWSTNPDQGGPEDSGYTAHNKPAEDVLRRWYEAAAD